MQGEIGLGTYKLVGDTCTRAVAEALEMGYRLIDTASVYGNHKDIAPALRHCPRHEIRLLSKLWIQDEVDDRDIDGSIRIALQKCLEELQTDYLDIYLIHWPNHQRDLAAMLQVMGALQDEGKIRQVGGSNFTKHHLQDACDAGIDLSWNQVEIHPMLAQRGLVDFSAMHGIQTMAYSPFGKGHLLSGYLQFEEIGKRYGKSGAQVILRWIIERGITAVPKASSRSHLLENFQAADFALSEGDRRILDGLDRNLRTGLGRWQEFDY